jgi:hypothetical protein
MDLQNLYFTLYELHAIDEKKFIDLSSPVEEIGKMLGGLTISLE